MAKRTLKTLVRDLHDVATESPAAVSVKIGGTNYSLTGTYVGTVAGESYGAVIIGDQTIIVELDRRGTLRNAKVIDVPDLEAVTKDLLPTPEPPAPPQEALDALSVLNGLKGFKIVIDAKGRPTIVAEDTSEKPVKTRAARGTAVPKPKRAPLVKGQLLTRNKDGYTYKVVSIDAANKKATLDPVTKGDGESMTVSYPVPVFWKAFREVA